jgi:threonine aldolase
MADEKVQRRWLARRACTRTLSGATPMTAAQRMESFRSGGFDLDALPDAYGDGPVRDLEARVAALLGKPAATFFPSGTMAQQVALRLWADRSGSNAVAMHPLNHLEVHEREGYVHLTGLRPVWLTREPRQPTADEVAKLDERFGTLTIELPLREPGFLLPSSFGALCEVVAAARARGAFVHFDGARLWESTVHLGQDLPTIAGLADSVYVSFYKTLGGISGSALVGPADFIAEARAWRHRYGGNIFQQWPSIFAAMSGLDTVLPRLEEYVAHAQTVAAALNALPGVRVHPNPPHTHQFQIWVSGTASALEEANLTLAETEQIWFLGGWRDQPPTGQAMTEVTILEGAMSWSAEQVTEVARKVFQL